MASLYPPEVLDSARSHDLAGFSRLFTESLVLVVRLPEEGGVDVLETLASTLQGLKTDSVRPIPAMDFHTEIVSPQALRELTEAVAATSRAVAPGRSTLGHVDRYVVRLRKRPDVDAAFAERVSVGRATNKDVVLRHKSISKFHAWFQIDESGIVFVADAGSKNGTKLNGVVLSPRDAAPVSDGDTITFGSIDVLACTPEHLWRMTRNR